VTQAPTPCYPSRTHANARIGRSRVQKCTHGHGRSRPVAEESAEHKPFVPADKDIPELTPVPLIVGALLGILFGASSMYLVLKVGLTVSASIPVAVLSITIFRGFTKIFRTRRATILENNITQTAGSAGESIAFAWASPCRRS